jgi:hypothetical protein
MTTNLRKFHSSKRGETVETTLTDVEARDLLKAKAPNDKFAKDLCAQFPKLSQEQLFWLHKKALALNAPPAVKKGIEVGEFTRIHAMFDRAKTHLKHPKIMLADHEGHVFSLSLAPAEGKNPDCVYLKDGNKQYLGKITRAGEYFPSRTVPATVVSYLRKFSADPETIAAEYGKLHGVCCFCNRNLTDERSTDVGYGPVCSARFGLTWGSRQPKK